MSDLIKPTNTAGVATSGSRVSITGKPNASALHNRLNQAKVEDKVIGAADPLTASNRIAIMCDCSGSMASEDGTSKAKIDNLKDALFGFIQQCNFADTSVALETFPESGGYYITRDKAMLTAAAMGLRASGGTPMADAMNRVLQNVPLTRGIIISDGAADSPQCALDSAKNYAEQETAIDCVHIGSVEHGEQLLKDIAKLTGGIYIKFTDVGNFAKSFAYLTPAKRGELTAKIAGFLGAAEIRL